MSALPKPQLRNLHVNSMKKHIGVMVVLSITGALAYKFFVADVRKQKYADFYKTYDPEKQLKIMIDAGLMQSSPR